MFFDYVIAISLGVVGFALLYFSSQLLTGTFSRRKDKDAEWDAAMNEVPDLFDFRDKS